jgi:predicted Zn-dependent protease
LKAGQAYLAAAQLSRSHDYLTKAGELFEQGVKKWPDEPTFYAYAAEVALKQTNNAHAEEILLALPARKSWANRFEPYLLLAEFYEKTGKPQRQIVMIQEALRVAPSEPKVLQRRDAIPGFPAAPASAPAAR